MEFDEPNKGSTSISKLAFLPTDFPGTRTNRNPPIKVGGFLRISAANETLTLSFALSLRPGWFERCPSNLTKASWLRQKSNLKSCKSSFCIRDGVIHT